MSYTISLFSVKTKQKEQQSAHPISLKRRKIWKNSHRSSSQNWKTVC